MKLSRRKLGQVVAGTACTLLLPHQAFGSSLIALSLQELVQKSGKVAVVTPGRARSSWATVSGQRRIITQTEALIQDVWLAQRVQSPGGDPPSGEDEDAQQILVTTLGGRVGEIGQKVSGEAELNPDLPCLLFLSGRSPSGRRVVGMAQGHYGLRNDGRDLRLELSPKLPGLVRRKGHTPAVDTLSQLELGQARKLVLGGL